MSHTFVIAEPGCTAQGDLATMLRQIDMAASCGADAFKSQWTSSAERMCERRQAPDYLPYYRWLQWPVDWHRLLAERCRYRRIKYGCSIYLAPDAERVATFVDFLKVSSFEAQDDELLSSAARTGKRIIVSTGMGSVVPLCANAQLLHCVSAYPAPEDQMNLRRVDWCGGLSDHSRQIDMGGLAVAAGARVIETHVRLDDCDPDNPDYDVAFTPDEFADYIQLIRRAERIMGDGHNGAQSCEAEMMKYRVVAS